MKHYEKNPRKITPQQATDLQRWLGEYGDLSGIVHNITTDEIIGGNQRADAMDILDGMQPKIEHKYKTPTAQGTVATGYVTWKGERFAYRQVKWTPEKAAAAVVIANKAGGQWDTKKLKEYFDQAKLLTQGFNKNELIKAGFKILDDIKDAIPQIDKARKLQDKWRTKPGQLWQLGPHYLFIGDCTIAANVEKLMRGAKADLIYTDPPYGVSYTGTNNAQGRDWGAMANDDLRNAALQTMLTAAFKLMYKTARVDTALYCWHASSTQMQFELALKDAGYKVKQQLIWNKGMVFGHADYHWAYEVVFYCARLGERTNWYGERTDKTILAKRRIELEQAEPALLIQIITALLDGSTVWEVDRDAVVEYQHATQKPTRLAIRAIDNSCKPGGVVTDFFVGSGTTIIAAENTQRICYAMELEATNAAVCLERYRQAFPKSKIVLAPRVK